jgi:hypothetical protein
MPDTAVSDRWDAVRDGSRLRRILPWIPLAVGVLAIVIGGVLFSPQSSGEHGVGPRPGGVTDNSTAASIVARSHHL